MRNLESRGRPSPRQQGERQLLGCEAPEVPAGLTEPC